jgi:hypothetical protein
MLIKDKILALFSKAPSKNINSDWDNVFLVDKTPPEWFLLRKTKIWWCAHYSLKAVIEWSKNIEKPIEAYSPDWWSKKTYLMTPWWIKKVLKKYKLKYVILKAKKLNDDEKLFLLKQNLKDGPIILLIANWQTKKKRFNRWKALTHRHYISLWWYDDKKNYFYVYDSNTKRRTENSVLEWTIKVPYKYILKSRWIWAAKIIYDYAIAVKY